MQFVLLTIKTFLLSSCGLYAFSNEITQAHSRKVGYIIIYNKISNAYKYYASELSKGLGVKQQIFIEFFLFNPCLFSGTSRSSEKQKLFSFDSACCQF